MWTVGKTVRVKDGKYWKRDSYKERSFKNRFRAILYLKFFCYWDADEELGMSNISDKDVRITYTLGYE